MENKKIWLSLLFTIFIVVAGIALLCIFNRPQPELNQPYQIETPIMNKINHPEINALILEIPVIEYQDGNQLSEPIITGYDQKIIRENDEFILDPDTLGYRLGQSVGAIKLKLVQILPDSITVAILADSQFDGNFHPRDPIENQNIENGTCIGAFPLVMDVYYQYCFILGKSDSKITLKYRLDEESTMPSP